VVVLIIKPKNLHYQPVFLKEPKKSAPSGYSSLFRIPVIGSGERIRMDNQLCILHAVLGKVFCRTAPP
jgi:hypothetical protein